MVMVILVVEMVMVMVKRVRASHEPNWVPGKDYVDWWWPWNVTGGNLLVGHDHGDVDDDVDDDYDDQDDYDDNDNGYDPTS